jgi:arylsulfatase A-like enzyme
MKKSYLIALFLLALILAGLAAWHFHYSFRHYNVLLITIDTQRADYLSCYNPKGPPTPNIDRIAKNGVLFRNAYCLIPITLASHTAILTSRSPHMTKVFNNGYIFDHHVPMVTDLLKPKGYTSAAFVSLGVLKAEYGLASGFKYYQDNFDRVNRHYKFASEVNVDVLPWLDKQRNSRFFAWVHYSDPHEPYIPIDAPPDTEVRINGSLYGRYCITKKEKETLNFIAKPGENQIEFVALAERAPKKIQLAESKRFLDRTIYVSPSDGIDLVFGDDWQSIKLKTGLDARYFAEKAVLKVMNRQGKPVAMTIRFSGGIWGQRLEVTRQNYVKEVQFVDTHIGKVWDKLVQLGLDKSTIIILTADHGEGLKTHGILGHVDRLWNEIIHVPLIIYYPNLGHRGTEATPLVNHLDIMPTILDLLHIENKQPMEGESLKRYVSRSPLDWLMSRKVKRETTFAYTFEPEARENSFAVTNGKTKVIHTPKKPIWQWEAYDLLVDPLEKRNLNKTNHERFLALSPWQSLLEGFRNEAESVQRAQRSPAMDEQQREMLRNLGYVYQREEHSDH